jgi:predicted small secreted protein
MMRRLVPWVFVLLSALFLAGVFTS